MRPVCYFAYSWENTEKTESLLEFTAKKLRQKNPKLKIVIDKEFRSPDDFQEREKEIFEADSVVLFCTPEYKRAILNDDAGRGVVREYRYILEVKKTRKIPVFCVVVEGGLKNSIPDEFKNKIAIDFSNTNIFVKGKNHHKYICTEKKEQYNNFLTDVCYETTASFNRKDVIYPNPEEANLALFVNTDTRSPLPRSAMYKSVAYEQVLSGNSDNFIVGRKGTGKSTFFEILDRYEPDRFAEKFKVLRPISADDINEESLFNIYKRMKKDELVFGYDKMLSLFWQIYLSMCVLYIVSIEEENERIRDDRRSTFHSVGNKLRNSFGVDQLDTPTMKQAIFVQSVSLWEAFLNSGVVDYATDKAFLGSIAANFNVENVMSDFLGKRLYRNFESCLKRCEKKVLIALDKFDAISEDFRRQSRLYMQSKNQKQYGLGLERLDFDGMLYRTLLTTVEGFQTHRNGLMYNAVFCLILPQDRVDQISLLDRDFDKRHFQYLTWDAIDLLTVILLRLKVVHGFEFNPVEEDPVAKYSEVLKTYLPTIPPEIKIDVDGKYKVIDLFQYLLRISFWRPRDLIKYFAILNETNTKNMAKVEILPDEALKTILDGVSREIISNEFFNEYRNVFFNIEDFMQQFREKNVVLSMSELSIILNNFHFEGAVFTKNQALGGIKEKLRIIYELGIIGFMVPKDLTRKYNVACTECFVFNEGLQPFEALKDCIVEENSKVQAIINPIFARSYSLNYNTSKIIGAYGWEYLWSNHLSH